MSEFKKGRGGARAGAGRKTKEPGVKRQTASWNIEAWIPQALQEIAKEHGVESASDIVNEALKSLCHLHGKSQSWPAPDPYQTSRWRFFTDQELTEVVEALRERFHQSQDHEDSPLRRIWLSAWLALEPQLDYTSHRSSILKPKQEIKDI